MIAMSDNTWHCACVGVRHVRACPACGSARRALPSKEEAVYGGTTRRPQTRTVHQRAVNNNAPYNTKPHTACINTQRLERARVKSQKAHTRREACEVRHQRGRDRISAGSAVQPEENKRTTDVRRAQAREVPRTQYKRRKSAPSVDDAPREGGKMREKLRRSQRDQAPREEASSRGEN
jgi:hypothetical protein